MQMQKSCNIRVLHAILLKQIYQITDLNDGRKQLNKFRWTE